MSTTPESARTVAIAADIADAVDPALPWTQRHAAARHAAEVHPVLAVSMATSFAYGMLAAFYARDPEGAARAARLRRAGIGA